MTRFKLFKFLKIYLSNTEHIMYVFSYSFYILGSIDNNNEYLFKFFHHHLEL